MRFSAFGLNARPVARCALLLVACMAAGMALAGPAGATGQFLWMDSVLDPGGNISSIGLDGSNPRVVLSIANTRTTTGFAADVVHGRLYWIEGDYNGAPGWVIKQSALDGTGVTTLSTSGATFNQPAGLAIDVKRGRLYWINGVGGGGGGGSIAYAALDGSGGGVLITSGVQASSTYPVVDAVAQRIYWHQGNSSFDLASAPLDGSGSPTALSIAPADCGLPSLSESYGFRIDRAAGFIYRTFQGSGNGGGGPYGGGVFGLLRTDVAGGACTIVGPTSGQFASDLAVDVRAQRALTANDGGASPTTNVGWWSLTAPFGFTWFDTGSAGSSDSGYVVAVDAPLAATATSLAPATAVPGQVLTCTAATWSEAGSALGDMVDAASTTGIAWQRDGSVIAGAAGATYTPTTAGSYTCSTSASNTIGTTTSASAAAVVALPVSTAPRLARAPKIVQSGSSVSLVSSVQVGAPGTLAQSATCVGSARAARAVTACTAKAQAKKAGTVTITCKLNAKARVALRKGALKLTLTTTFTETGKTASSTTRRVTVPRAKPSTRASHGLLG